MRDKHKAPVIRRSKCQASQSRLSIIDQQHETGPDTMIQIEVRELSESDLMILIDSSLSQISSVFAQGLGYC